MGPAQSLMKLQNTACAGKEKRKDKVQSSLIMFMLSGVTEVTNGACHEGKQIPLLSRHPFRCRQTIFHERASPTSSDFLTVVCCQNYCG